MHAGGIALVLGRKRGKIGAFEVVDAARGLAQKQRRLQLALGAAAWMQDVERGSVVRAVLLQGCTERGLGLAQLLVAVLIPAGKGSLGRWREMFEVAEVWIVGEVGKAAVDGAAQLGAVVAAPV